MLYNTLYSEEPEQDDWDRVDCYPEPGASEAGCKARGCIWKPSVDQNGQSTGAPWCFVPPTQGAVGFSLAAPLPTTSPASDC